MFFFMKKEIWLKKKYFKVMKLFNIEYNFEWMFHWVIIHNFYSSPCWVLLVIRVIFLINNIKMLSIFLWINTLKKWPSVSSYFPYYLVCLLFCRLPIHGSFRGGWSMSTTISLLILYLSEDNWKSASLLLNKSIKLFHLCRLWKIE